MPNHLFYSKTIFTRYSLSTSLLLALFASVGCSDSNEKNQHSSHSTNKTTSSTSTLSSFSSEDSANPQPLSSTPGSLPSSVHSASSSQVSLLLDVTPCSDFSAVATAELHSTYIVNAPSGDCFGVLHDGAQKRELPLSIEPSSTLNDTLLAGTTVKLYNSYEKGQSRWSTVTIDITNTSAEPVCFIDPISDLLSLYDQDDNEIALVSVGSYLDGSLYPLEFGRNTNTCLAPGQTLPYNSESLALPVDVVNAAAYAKMPPIDGSIRLGASANASPTMVSLNAQSDSVSAEFVNDTGNAITVSSFSQIIYYTADGYAIDYSFLSRQGNEGNVIESGDLFIMEDDYAPIYDYRPAHAARSIIYLKWEFLGQ